MKYTICICLFMFMFCAANSQDNASSPVFKMKGVLTFPVAGFNKVDKCGDHDAEAVGCRFIRAVSFYSDSSLPVKAILAGKVSAIFDIDGVYAVVIKSGEYTSYYYSLKKPALKKGDDIVAGQHLAYTAWDESKYLLQFGIYNGLNEEDAAAWFKWQ
jgi:hypothetical protein